PPREDRPEKGIQAFKSSTTRHKKENKSTKFNGIQRQYNLRPRIQTAFREGNPKVLVDRRRFPYFFEAFKDHLKLDTTSDDDYIPPSYSPTPGPSEYSLSVPSDRPSPASSTELFGLEVRSPS
ncbi:hypothetical protein K458DRAFT_261527, partial [Lentithecium fluviatile CBS 122367]